jgi:thioredoxin reductase (NADPH)
VRQLAGGGRRRGQFRWPGGVVLADAGSPTTIVSRGPNLATGMSRYLTDRIESDPRIELRTGTTIIGLDGDRSLTSIQVTGADGDPVVQCVALFSFIGAEPASEWLSGCAALDDRGFVLTGRSLDDVHLDGRTPWAGDPCPSRRVTPGCSRSATSGLAPPSGWRPPSAGSAAVGAVHDYLAFTP